MMSDYTVFSSPHFDANDYANATLAGETYPAEASGPKTTKAGLLAKEDLSLSIDKLSIGIDDVSKQIKTMVSNHHEQLLEQASGASDLSGSLATVRHGLNDLDTSLEKLRLKIRVPYQALQANVSKLQRLQQASDVLRRTSRFVILARRLESQMSAMETAGTQETQGADLRTSIDQALGGDQEDEKERTIAKAALSVAELVALLDGPATDEEGKDTTIIPLRSINAVNAHIDFIEEARATITAEMESMVMVGLSTLNQSLLASSLQTASNLRVLPELVQSLVLDLSAAVEDRIRSAFDLAKINKDALAKDAAPTSSNTLYKSRVRTEPTNVTAPQWSAAMWARLEILIEEMAGCCIKVYTLEKVLKLKKDTVSQTVFLDDAMKLLENKPSATFWTALARSLEKNARDAARNSTFLQQTLSTGYPRLLRLFHEFFAKIAVHTDTVYTQAHQSPETVLILRALSNFEALYLSRSSTRLNEVVGQAFSGGARSPPGMGEGVNIARTIANELDSARFDPLLVKSVARSAVTSIELMIGRVDILLVRDRSAVSMIGPTATPQQQVNAQLATCLYRCYTQLEKLKEGHTDAVFAILKPSIKTLSTAYNRIVDPLLTAIRRELGAIITKLHRVDFTKSVDMGGGPSLYMKDLVEKLSFTKSEILGNFNVGEAGGEWTIAIVKYVIRVFVLHVSIAKPIGESGKLQLTSDMTELEFSLSAFLSEGGKAARGNKLDVVGEDYRALRAMRPLLFLDNLQLTSTRHTEGLPPLIVLHHIMVRSVLPLPHTLHGWQEAEYVRWVDEHTEEEALSLVESGLSHWEKMADAEGEDTSKGVEYVELARTVLGNTRLSP